MADERVEISAYVHPYEAPSIEDRTPIDMPLIGGNGSIQFSAAFRPL